VNPLKRRRFDDELQWVLQRLPPQVHELFEKIPLHVEDYPSKEVLRATGVKYMDELCGLFTGIPIGDRGPFASGTLPDVVTIYREGILKASSDRQGRIATEHLRHQIRITILHELGHYHGMTEANLRELGYE
jgi:predicted Zn-dependent protease with MMP-like domain